MGAVELQVPSVACLRCVRLAVFSGDALVDLLTLVLLSLCPASRIDAATPQEFCCCQWAARCIDNNDHELETALAMMREVSQSQSLI